MEVTSKICTGCGFILPAHADYFYRNKNGKDGFNVWCKRCMAKYEKGNRDKTSLRKAKYNKANKYRIAEYRAKYKKENKDRIAEYNARYRNENKDKMAEYYKVNKDKITIRNAEYNKVNKNKISLGQAKYHKASAKYKIYNSKLKKYEQTRNNNGILEARCAYCGKWFKPTNGQARARIHAINGITRGESRFYCQDFCKIACPVYGQILHIKQNKYTKSNEVSPRLRQTVFELDNYECQMCGSKDELHCHHILPAALNPMTSHDPDVCITLCKKCHANVHSKAGCRYHELKCA